MKKMTSLAFAALIFGSLVGPVMADPDKDESGHGRGKGWNKTRDHKQEYWDGRCKVERKWEKGGEYKEERKCKGGQGGAGQHDSSYYAPPQRLYPAQAAIVIQPQVVIRP